MWWDKPQLFVIRHQCAALAATGCPGSLVYESKTKDIDIRLLKLNGWRQDHGRWICGLPHIKGGTTS